MQIGTYVLAAEKPALMGILNATPDSFSDGGLCLDTSAALDRALFLSDSGADIIDVGGESTRPGANPVSEEEEIGRTIPLIEAIRKRTSIPVSIDTTKAEVARRALDAGADMINDISAGRFDPALLQLAAERGLPICLMHMQGVPRSMQQAPRYEDLLGEIRLFFLDAVERARGAGIGLDKIILDPGIGFGKGAEDNVTILKNLRLLEISVAEGKESGQKLKLPMLIGTSRKSFMGKLLGYEVDQRLEGTLATLAVAVDAGAAILRIHDVAPARRFIDTYLLCRP